MAAVKILDTVELPLAVLKPFPGNARRSDMDKLRASVREFGQYRSILVREVSGEYVTVAGNHTAEAMSLEGHAVARCELIECSDKVAVQVNLLDNRMADLGSYENELLLAALEELDGDFEITGYTADDLDDLLATLDKIQETEFQETGAHYAETEEELQARAGHLAASGPPLAARGIRETVIILMQDDHDELHRHLAQLRPKLPGDDLTNGEILLRSARSLRAIAETSGDHEHDCGCNWCVLLRDVGSPR